jgi:hypothetical protein
MKKLANNIYSPPTLTHNAVTHGRVHEQSAADEFVKTTGKLISECGLFVSQEHPYLAASPDRTLKGEDALVEIKCPFNGREKRVLPGKDFSFLEMVGGQVQLKRSHDYYYQIVGQLAICKNKFCFFVVYTFSDIYIEKIDADQAFFENRMLPPLKEFFDNHYCPLIISNM